MLSEAEFYHMLEGETQRGYIMNYRLTLEHLSFIAEIAPLLPHYSLVTDYGHAIDCDFELLCAPIGPIEKVTSVIAFPLMMGVEAFGKFPLPTTADKKVVFSFFVDNDIWAFPVMISPSNRTIYFGSPELAPFTLSDVLEENGEDEDDE